LSFVEIYLVIDDAIRKPVGPNCHLIGEQLKCISAP
jgi:hypothetical protein